MEAQSTLRPSLPARPLHGRALSLRRPARRIGLPPQTKAALNQLTKNLAVEWAGARPGPRLPVPPGKAEKGRKPFRWLWCCVAPARPLAGEQSTLCPPHPDRPGLCAPRRRRHPGQRRVPLVHGHATREPGEPPRRGIIGRTALCFALPAAGLSSTFSRSRPRVRTHARARTLTRTDTHTHTHTHMLEHRQQNTTHTRTHHSPDMHTRRLCHKHNARTPLPSPVPPEGPQERGLQGAGPRPHAARPRRRAVRGRVGGGLPGGRRGGVRHRPGAAGGRRVQRHGAVAQGVTPRHAVPRPPGAGARVPAGRSRARRRGTTFR
jgi:hypothetical protein